ncbi:hypothetical protein BH11PLA1_BH11PLA1_04050 [soil metagenome]
MKHKAYASGVNFDEWDAIEREFAARLDGAETDAQIETVLSEMLANFKCSHLSILKPREVAERTAGIRTGPGLTTQQMNGALLVCSVVDDGPAAEIGLRPGDLITAVDGRNPTASSLSGPAGEQRLLAWRSEESDRSSVLIFREHRRASPDLLTFLQDGTAVISVHSFSDRLYDPAVIKEMFDRAQSAPALILDLRSNKGGNAANVEHLIGQVTVLRTAVCVDIYRDDADETRAAHPGSTPKPTEIVAHVAPNGRSIITPPDETIYSGPMAVLVDSQCGSGGELTPFTLQRIGRAIVVGTPTPGRVRIGSNFKLVAGFEIQAPIGEFVASDGSIIEGVGVRPDVLLTPQQTARDAACLAAARLALRP